MKHAKLWITTAAIVLGLTIFANAQNRGGDRPRPGGSNNNNGGGGGGRPGGFGGNFDPSEFRQRMNERMKEELAASDEEWKNLEPKIEKVRTLQRESRMDGMDFGGFGNWGGRGGRDGGGRDGGRGGDNNNATTREGGERPGAAIEKARESLRDALKDTNTAPDEIAKRLQALRDARDKVRKDLVAAQADLKGAATAWQEARLVSMGLLE